MPPVMANCDVALPYIQGEPNHMIRPMKNVAMMGGRLYVLRYSAALIRLDMRPRT